MTNRKHNILVFSEASGCNFLAREGPEGDKLMPPQSGVCRRGVQLSGWVGEGGRRGIEAGCRLLAGFSEIDVIGPFG